MNSNNYMNQFNDFMDGVAPSMSLMDRQDTRQAPACADPTQQKPNQKQNPERILKPIQRQAPVAIKKQLAEPNRKYANAYIKIVEQPASKAVRFRYECEGRTAGSIPGVNSTPALRTYPTIEIVGYKGRSVCVVSCVSADPPYRPHPHTLVGKKGCKSGVYTFSVNEVTMRAELCNLGIQCVKKKDIEASLKVREEVRVDPFKTGFSHAKQPGSININAVRLCFQVFIQGENGHFTVPLKPVVTEPIYDKKSKSDLVIREMCSSGTVLGNTTIMLLCEKVTKEDIAVRFFEEKNGAVVWQAYGEFDPSSVHKQTAIGLRTPQYHNTDIEEPVQVFVQLQRPSDGAVSEPCEFNYEPVKKTRLRRKCRLNDLTMTSLKVSENQTVTNKPIQNNITLVAKQANLDKFFVSGEMTPSPEPLSPSSSTSKIDTSTTTSPYGKVTEVINLESGMVDIQETLNVETIPTTLEIHEESKVYAANQKQSQFPKLQNIRDQQQHPHLDDLLQQPNRSLIKQQQSQGQLPHQNQKLQLQLQQHKYIPAQLQEQQYPPTLQLQQSILPQQQQQPQQPLRPKQEQQHPPPLRVQQPILPQQQQQPQQLLHPQPLQMPYQQQGVPQQPQTQLQQQQQWRLMQQRQQLFLGETNREEKLTSILALAVAALSNNPFNMQQFLNATAGTMPQNGQHNSVQSSIKLQPSPPVQQQHQFVPAQQKNQFVSPQQQQPPQQDVSSQSQFQQQSNVATNSNDKLLVGEVDAKNNSNSDTRGEASSISQLLNLDSDQLVKICDGTLLDHTITDDF
ncbi:embryonic polarity protein dorsal-like [Bactrocera tryoni]|uniref:embryonic polarity protein dorsal-like n=1 Tax=Bactrocera tryoni TaxID=59916 RepID=UPI001A95A324|nr:embryonic polarity protein dorsal-like [Bactrocera tryoni]